MPLGEHVFRPHALVDARLSTRDAVQIRSERLGQPIGERLHENRVVVVVLALEAAHQIVDAEACGHRERAKIVGHAVRAARRDEVGQRQVRLTARHRLLLSQQVESRQLARSIAIAIDDDVVLLACRRPESVDAARRQQLLLDDPIEERLRVAVELARRGAVLRVIENRREASLQLPRREEERPVDERHQRLERHRRQHAAAGERGRRRRPARPIDLEALGLRRVVREQRPLFARAVLLAQPLLQLVIGVDERAAALGAQQAGDHVDDPRRVEHVNGRRRVLGRDLHRGVLPAGRRAADEERRLEAAPLHLARDQRHLVERGRDQAAQANQIRLPLDRRRQDLVGRHHHAEIDDVVAVAAEHDADDVLADVVYVALDGGEHDRPLGRLL